MKKPNEAQVKAYMRTNLTDHVNLDTGELNHTTLAENATFHFNAYEHGCEIPEEFFDWAIEVGEQLDPDIRCPLTVLSLGCPA